MNKEYQDTERNGFGPFSWNGTTEQGTICHACWNGTENHGTVHRTERNGPERKWPYLDTTGLPEANDRCILHVSASSTTFDFLKKIKKLLQGCRPDPCPPPGPPPGVTWTKIQLWTLLKNQNRTGGRLVFLVPIRGTVKKIVFCGACSCVFCVQ